MKEEARGPRSLLAVVATLALVLAAAALVLRLLPATAFEHVYGQLLYPGLSNLLQLFTGWTDLPLGMILLPPGIGLLLWLLLRPGNGLGWTGRIAALACVGVVLVAGYYLSWGANYRRPPLSQLLDLPAERAGDEQMLLLAEDMLAWVSATHGEERDEKRALRAVAGELELLAREIGYPARVPVRLKTLPPGTLQRAGYAGMIMPYTLEAQVDGGLTPPSRLAVGAHELAHVAGLASEADADLASVVAALRSADPFARYSLALSLLSRVLPSLPAAGREAIEARLPPEASADLARSRLRAQEYLRASFARRVTAVYDRLLRDQGVQAGVRDYRRLPDLAARANAAGLLPEPPEAATSRPAQPCRTGRPDCAAAVPRYPVRAP